VQHDPDFELAPLVEGVSASGIFPRISTLMEWRLGIISVNSTTCGELIQSFKRGVLDSRCAERTFNHLRARL
jgi:hypothetical protein